MTVLVLSLMAAACGGDPEVEATETPVAELTPAPVTPTPEPTKEPTPTPTPTPTPVPAAPLTGEPISDESVYDLPVVAVKIDNDRRARPQVGIDEADVVFVEPIEGLTRLVAIFHSGGSGEVGPVRSGRRVDPKLFGSFMPIFAFSGAAGPNYPFIDGGFPHTVVNDRSRAGWRREGSRSAPHNLFIPIETIRERRPDAPAAGAEPAFAFSVEQPVGGIDTDGFTVDYGRFRTQSGWTWEEGVGWLRSQNGTPHTGGLPDRTEGETVVAANVVVMTVPTTGSQVEPITVLGEGPARIHRGGQVFEGTWSKPTAADQYVFTSVDGVVLPLAPGSTWVEVHPSSGSYIPGAPVVAQPPEEDPT